MFKKAISYVWLYAILFNILWWAFFIAPVNATWNWNTSETLVSSTLKQNSVNPQDFKNYADDRVIIKFKQIIMD